MWSQRFIQLSAAIPDTTNPKRSRMIPIAMEMIPKLPKPAKDASAQKLVHYEKMKALNSPGAQNKCREQVDVEQVDTHGFLICMQ
jgi:hypothetical protein